jgi:hypothetical protein
LNKLVKEYKANEVKKDMFYQEQKSQRQKESLNPEDRLKHQEGLSKMKEYRDTIQKASDDAKANQLELEAQPSLIDNTGTSLNSLLNISDGLESSTSSTSSAVTSDDSKPQAITQSLELGGEDSKEITLEDETQQLMADDPWMQRKMAEQKGNVQ